MLEESEQVLQEMDNGYGLTEQMIAEFEERLVTQNISSDSVTEHNIQNALEE